MIVLTAIMSAHSSSLLIVDDSRLIGDKLADAVKELGSFDFIGQACDIDSGRKMYRETQPDVVILDIGFIKGSGLTLLEEIRKINRVVTIIIFTNYTHNMYFKKCMDAGANYFLDKSKDYEVLIQILENYRQQKVNIE